MTVDNQKNCDRLVTENIKLVYFCAKKYINHPWYEDLIQEGTIELIKAARKFDPSLGYQFSTFAVPYIRGGILHLMRDKVDVIRKPRNGASIPVLSLNAATSSHTDEPTEFIEFVPANEAPSDDHIELIQEFAKILPEKEQLVFRMHLNKASNKAIAEKLGVSPMTITRHINRLIKLAKEWIDAFLNNKPPIKIEGRIGSREKRVQPAAIDTPEAIDVPAPKEKTRWDHLRIDIEVAFDLYIKNPSWRSIDRTIEALYKFGRLAIGRKYWQLNGSDILDHIFSWEDLLHESICKLRQSLIDLKIQSHNHAIAMLYVFAKYSYWKVLKQSAKYTSLNRSISAETDTTLEDIVASTMAAITPERSQDLESIETALAKLPSINKQVIELAWIEGKAVTEISQQMQMTVPTVSSILQKSRIAIARELVGRKMSLGY